jgi:hypothetical protein
MTPSIGPIEARPISPNPVCDRRSARNDAAHPGSERQDYRHRQRSGRDPACVEGDGEELRWGYERKEEDKTVSGGKEVAYGHPRNYPENAHSGKEPDADTDDYYQGALSDPAAGDGIHHIGEDTNVRFRHRGKEPEEEDRDDDQCNRSSGGQF